MKIKNLIITLLLSIGLLSCAGDKKDATVNSTELSNSISGVSSLLDGEFNAMNNYVVSWYDTLKKDQCKNTDALKNQWKGMMDLWMKLQFFKQGPLENKVFQRWPSVLVNTSKIDTLVTGKDPAKMDLTWFDNQVSSGFSNGYNDIHALEYLLFGRQDLATNLRACDLALAITQRLFKWSNSVTRGAVDDTSWFGENGFRNNYVNPGSDTLSLRKLHQDWLTDYVSAFETIKKYKLEEPMGWDEGACLSNNYQPIAGKVESAFAKISIPLIFSQLKNLEDKYQAVYHSMLSSLNQGLTEEIDKNFNTALFQKDKLKNINLFDYIQTHTKPVEIRGTPEYPALLKLHYAIRNLTVLFKNDVAGLLKVTVSFNSADGDSGRPASTNCWGVL